MEKLLVDSVLNKFLDLVKSDKILLEKIPCLDENNYKGSYDSIIFEIRDCIDLYIGWNINNMDYIGSYNGYISGEIIKNTSRQYEKRVSDISQKFLISEFE